MDNKQLAILSNPLRKIEAATVVANEHLLAIRGFVEFTARKAYDSLSEMQKQTNLLKGIDSKISSIFKQNGKDSKSGDSKGAGKKALVETPSKKLKIKKEDIDQTAMMLVAVSGALFLAALLFTGLPSISGGQFLTAIGIAATFALISPVFVKIMESLNKIKGGGKGDVKGGDSKSVWGLMGMSMLVMVGLSAAIVLTSIAFQLIQPLTMEQAGTAILVSLVMVGLSLTFVQILKAFETGKIKADKSGVLMLGMATMAMMAISIGLVATSFILQGVQQVDPEKLYSAFLIGITLIPISFAFAMIAKSLEKASIGQVLLASLAIPLIALGLSAAAHIFNETLPDKYKAPPTEWILLSGFTLAIYAASFYLISKGVKGLNIGQLIFTALAIPLIALAVVGTAFVFQYLSNIGDYIAPAPEWTLKAGFAIFAFALPFALISMVIGKFDLGFKDLGLGLLATIATSLAIVGVAFIFQLLSYVGSYEVVPTKWATAASAAILIFAVPLMAIGLIAKTGGGATAIGLGLLGVVLTAVAIGLVALIFTGIGNIPGFKSGMQNVVDVLFMPFNNMVDVLKKLKDEIGINNLVPLAGGILAIAGAWLALTAAMAGSAVGGLFGAAANVGKAILDGISSIFGGEKAKTPFDLLNLLVASSSKVIKMAKPIKQFGVSFGVIAQNAENVIKGLSAFTVFTDEDNQLNITKSATAMAKIGSAFTTISIASKSMNVEAMKATKGTFDALARIANSPKDNPLTKLADNLFTAIEELTGVVNNLEQSVGTQSSATGAFANILNNVADRIGDAKEKVQQTANSSEGSNMDLTPLIAAITELEDRLNQPIFTIEIED